MSDYEDGKESRLTSSQRARRFFLSRAAVATAGVSAAGMLSAMDHATTCDAEKAAPRNCPNVKVPMREVEGKVAFITGGSSGIGLGIARAFADAGMKVVIGYLTKVHLDQAMKFLENAGDRVHAIRVDVTDRPGMEKAAAEVGHVFGKLHVLVNNAGVVGLAALSSTTYNDWDWMMGVNVNGVFNGVRAFLPRILAHGEGGQIITTSSIAGLVGGGGAACYYTSKFAVVGMMESLRAELDDANVGVSVYCPGAVSSNILDSNRNRPDNLADSGFNRDVGIIAWLEQYRKNPELTMDPIKAGQLVLRGMRSNDLYILTHPETEQIIRDRSEALIASFPKDLRLTDAQVVMMRLSRQNIYSTERDRKLCAQATRASVSK